MSELKRCPCCKAQAKIITGSVFMWEHAVSCSECGLSTKMYGGIAPSEARNKAIEAWNTRKPVERILERVKKLNLDGLKMIEDGTFELIRKKEAIEIVKEECGVVTE